MPCLMAADVPRHVARGGSARLAESVEAEYRAGDRVRARNMHPALHTRLPRYVRGRTGTVLRDHGVFSFPDTSATGRGPKPQHVYLVRFEASELWGDLAHSADAVLVDLWDDYLERA
jgi:nitrile hydratase